MKLSHDPNNTRWTSNTQSFGHKIMSSQGWKPGEYLGAKDAAHAEFHTAANASHIRVMIKDDNLGLGAKIGSGVGHGECTGLDAFKNLLGRLNGKDEDELEKEQKSREDLKRAIYTERRWGSIRFVQGGFLVGDKIQNLIDGEVERVRKLAAGNAGSGNDSTDSSDSSDSDEQPKPVVEKLKKSKKRKLEERVEAPELVAVKVKKSKKKRKSNASPEDAAEIAATQEDVKRSKKKSTREREAKAEAEEEEEEVSEIKKQRMEKRDRKDKTEKGDKSKSGRDQEPTTKESRKKSKRYKKKADHEPLSESAESIQPTIKEHTPSTPLETESGRSTPIIMQGRHAVRARNIAQKRLASMDVASLNQVSLPSKPRIQKFLTCCRYS
jgi:Pin2-interacting protein X1